MPGNAVIPGRGQRRAVRRGSKRWSITVTATFLSTYAVDALATAAGLGLVKTGWLDEVATTVLLVALAGTYVIWGSGLRVALRANWVLLETTGTSTNVLSKAAHDLAAARASHQLTKRIATGAGYIVTELIKEVPYLAGALGMAAFSEAVSSREAIIFLAGANLGAASYEYSLAWGTHALLALTSRRCSAAGGQHSVFRRSAGAALPFADELGRHPGEIFPRYLPDR